MGAPPNEDQMAAMLENPTVAATVREALDNPAFVDHMIQSNPTLAAMPNAREMLTSPYFRNMMSNPEAIRVAARMRRMMGGQGGGSAFPAPGVTDGSDGAAAGDNSGAQMPPFPFLPGMASPFGAPPGATAANPFGNLFGPGSPFGIPPAAGTAAAPGATGATAEAGSGTAPAQGDAAAQQAANPFAALFGGAAPAAGGQGANPFGFPALSPEAAQQMMQMWGMGPPGAGAPAAPADTRPPEERYAEQLRQLNDMGFFDFDQNIAALRRSGGSVQGAIEHLLGGS